MSIHSMSIVVFVAVWICCLPAKLTVASVHRYNNAAFKELGNSYLLPGGSEGLFYSPSNPSPGTVEDEDYTPERSVHAKQSYIRFENITFFRTLNSADEQSQGTKYVQVIIFETADRNKIGGSAYGGQRSICCTPDLATLQGCKVREIIRIPSAEDSRWPIVLTVQFGENEVSANMKDQEVYISKSGMYNLFFITCDPALNGLTMSGKTIWKNANGYLPGRMAPLKRFYGIMILIYFLLAVVWSIQNSKFWIDVLMLQHCISVLIGLGFLDMMMWYTDFAHFNRTGTRPVVLTSWAVTVGVVRKTLSRLLILCVSMGYGVVRPTLGGITSKVLLLGMTYFLASESLDIAEYVGSINDVSGRAKLFLVLPDAFLDAFLISWIFISLSKTLEQLQTKRSSVKLDIYRKFSNALVITVAASVVWIVYEVYFKATDPFNEKWRNAWIITAFWDILAFVLLCVICYLWAPSQASQRYAYSEQYGDEDGEEGVALTRVMDDESHSHYVEEREKKIDDLDGESDGEEDKRE